MRWWCRNVVTNYSRFADTDGVFVPTSITIGYDTPWRQVRGAAAPCRLPHAWDPPHARAGRPAAVAAGLLRQVHVALLPRAARGARKGPGCGAHQHPRRVQRIRCADHVAQLRGRSRTAENRAARPVVCRAGSAARGRGARYFFFGGYCFRISLTASRMSDSRFSMLRPIWIWASPTPLQTT